MNFFNHVMDREAAAIITEEFRDIAITDMHIIEAIGVDEPKNMSAIARKLSKRLRTEGLCPCFAI